MHRRTLACALTALALLLEALRLLAAEGCPVVGERVDMARARWAGPREG